jgi:hypothetical protein
MIKKIYIKLIDGTETWVPINAKLVNRGQYRIIDNDKFLDLSTDELYEFLPGDIVEIEDHVFHDGTSGKVASRLISMGQWTDRNYIDFKFKATLGILEINHRNAIKFKQEIKRVKKEKSTGIFLYPAIIDTAEELSQFLDE